MKSQKYVVSKSLGLDFLDTIDLTKNEGEFEGVKFTYDPEKVKTFQRSSTCLACGLKSSVVHLEKLSGCNHVVYGAIHLNLHGVTPGGKNILFTVDHDILKSEGGPNTAENYNTMCTHCNKRRSNKYPVLQDFLKLYEGLSTEQYWKQYEHKHTEFMIQKRLRKEEKRKNSDKFMQTAMLAHIGAYNRHMKKLKKELTDNQ